MYGAIENIVQKQTNPFMNKGNSKVKFWEIDLNGDY